jgi:hypothetical protein
MIAYLQREHPECLPRHRLEVTSDNAERTDMPAARRLSVSGGR